MSLRTKLVLVQQESQRRAADLRDMSLRMQV
jgi:hypothetical protein